MAAKRTGRQAVVLIHGIGEQHPMGTIRPFVRAVFGSAGNQPIYFSKPDPMSSLFELRKLQSTSAPRTDFYEYYWAYNVEGTKLWDVLSWLLRLVGRPRRDVPDGLRGLWLISRLLLAAIVILLVAGGFSAYAGWFELQPQYGIVWLVLTLLFSAVQLVMVAYLGDAARYLSPRPANISHQSSW